MSDEIRLSSTVTVKRYREIERAKDRAALANFIYERLSERYIQPVTSAHKNGFAMMACASLLIETLESFYSGWKSTEQKGMSKKAFAQFFARDSRFADFRGLGAGFHKHVRCGILHQGETTNGWRITRKNDAPLLDLQAKTIHAEKFLIRLDSSLRDYCHTLRKSDWNSEPWSKCRYKMNAIIENCEAKH